VRSRKWPKGYEPTAEARAAEEYWSQKSIQAELGPYDDLPERVSWEGCLWSCRVWLHSQPDFPDGIYYPLPAGLCVRGDQDTFPWRVEGTNLCLVAVVRQGVEDSAEGALVDYLERDPAFVGLLEWLRQPPDDEVNRRSYSVRAEQLGRSGIRAALASTGLPATGSTAEYTEMRALGIPADAWPDKPGIEKTRRYGSLIVTNRRLDPVTLSDGSTFHGSPTYPTRGAAVTTFCLAACTEAGLEPDERLPPAVARVVIQRVETVGGLTSELSDAARRALERHADWWTGKHAISLRAVNGRKAGASYRLRPKGQSAKLDEIVYEYDQYRIDKATAGYRAVAALCPSGSSDAESARARDRMRKRLSRTSRWNTDRR